MLSSRMMRCSWYYSASSPKYYWQDIAGAVSIYWNDEAILGGAQTGEIICEKNGRRYYRGRLFSNGNWYVGRIKIPAPPV